MVGYELQDFLEHEVTVPRNDGTQGSALYAVPYRHRSDKVLTGYIRDADLWRNNVTERLGR